MSDIVINATYSCYMDKVFVIWDKVPYFNVYEVYRDNKLIATSEGGDNPFKSPTEFDHDHHTHLFKKTSTHKLMFVDEDFQRFQEYGYHVVAKRVSESGTVMEKKESVAVFIKPH